MFTLCDPEEVDMVGGAGMEKRLFKFNEGDGKQVRNMSQGQEDRFLEVRVCRANVKVRVPRKIETVDKLKLPASSGIE